MEFEFDLEEILHFDENKIVIIDPSNISKCLKKNPKSQVEIKQNLKLIIDKMGKASSEAQKLNKIITSYIKISGTRIYMKIEKKKAIGFIKIGEKHLFYRDIMGKIFELDAMTVLDFYVHETEQRKGNGIVIYESMLDYEKISPHQLGIDSPSVKFISFMEKYFGLSQFRKQSSNFVIFDDFFDEEFKSQNGFNKTFKNFGFAVKDSQGSSLKFKNYLR